MAEDAAPTTPDSSASASPASPASPASEPLDAWPTETMLWQFYWVMESEDVAACCVGAESLQGSLSATVVRLQCLKCERIRHAPSRQAEIIA